MIITGMQGAGKTTACDYLSEKWGKKSLRFPKEKMNNINDYRNQLIEFSKSDDIVDLAIGEASAIRLLELECSIILIKTEELIRIDRISKRNYKTRDEIQTEYGRVWRGMLQAQNAMSPNITITNNSTIENYYKKLDKICLTTV